MIECLQIIIMAYALGSVPFGVVLAKLFRLPDPRSIGSGNIGATNMLRTGRKDVALLTLLLDGGKGAVAVLLVMYLFLPLSIDPSQTYLGISKTDCMPNRGPCVGCILMCPLNGGPCVDDLPRSGLAIDKKSIEVLMHPLLSLALLCAAVGHMYSPWLKFKGGKGMATLLGGALAFSWPVGMAMLVVWILVAFTTRYVSVASIAALALAPFTVWLRVDGPSAFIIAIACAIAIWRHRDNIKRLRDGFEPKVKLGGGK
ncbi:MAG: glycerol-3-phosphate 1-O-acyltransferase PlsY [Rickettsiales bacterium]